MSRSTTQLIARKAERLPEQWQLLLLAVIEGVGREACNLGDQWTMPHAELARALGEAGFGHAAAAADHTVRGVGNFPFLARFLRDALEDTGRPPTEDDVLSAARRHLVREAVLVGQKLVNPTSYRCR